VASRNELQNTRGSGLFRASFGRHPVLFGEGSGTPGDIAARHQSPTTACLVNVDIVSDSFSRCTVTLAHSAAPANERLLTV
jgi:hypothetical protein